MKHYDPKLLDSSDPPTSASQVAGTVGINHTYKALLKGDKEDRKEIHTFIDLLRC